MRTDQDGDGTNGISLKVDILGGTDNTAPMKSSFERPSPQHTISTCPTWETSDSPTSLALKPTFSMDSDEDASDTNPSANATENNVASDNTDTDPTDGQSNAMQLATATPNRHLTIWHNRLTSEQKKSTTPTSRSPINISSELTSERKKWIENTLMSNEYKPHSTPARDEYCKNQYSSDLASERKQWVQETLLSTEYKAYPTKAREEMCQNQYNSDLTLERKKWVQQTLLNTEHKAFSTNAREEMCQNQYNSDLTSERKRWIESTLLSTNSYTNKKNNSQDELQELQKQATSSLSVAERRQWLSGVTHVKSAAELEEEVREETRRLKEEAKRAAKEEEARKMIADAKRAEEEEVRKAIIAEEKRKQAMISENITCKESQCKHSLDEEVTNANSSSKKKRRKLGLKKLVKVFTPKRR